MERFVAGPFLLAKESGKLSPGLVMGRAARCAEFANGREVSTCAVAWHPWLVTEHAL